MHLNMMKEAELSSTVENTHELTKDTMLEKVVLISSAYFCIATEIRFILQSEDSLNIRPCTESDHPEIPTAIISMDPGVEEGKTSAETRSNQDMVTTSNYGQVATNYRSSN